MMAEIYSIYEEHDMSVPNIRPATVKPIKIYPICEYAGIVTLPDDIKSDWLSAAEAAILFALSLERTGEDNKWLLLAADRTVELGGSSIIRTVADLVCGDR